MREIFTGWYRPREEDIERTWESGLIILDASVLLNLYRYPKESRTDFLRALEMLGTRIWIPHHVALEYQRNRLVVIAEQQKRFSEFRRLAKGIKNKFSTELGKLELVKRFPIIDIKPLLSGIESHVDELLKSVAQVESEQLGWKQEDEIREKLDSLFSGKIGRSPISQEEIDRMSEGIEQRFALQKAPGYLDAKSKLGSFECNGLRYHRAHGDAILWLQILDHIQTQPIKDVVFVTDDEKQDWWHYSGFGDDEKAEGPIPSLVEEFISSGGRTLLFVTSESFLRDSKKYLSIQVSDESIRRIGENLGALKILLHSSQIEQLLHRELTTRYSGQIELHSTQFPDIVVSDGNKRIGYEIVVWPKNVAPELTSEFLVRLRQAEELLDDGILTEFRFAVVFDDESVGRLFVSSLSVPNSLVPFDVTVEMYQYSHERIGGDAHLRFVDFFYMLSDN